jgi:hypothetical protein
MESAKRIDICRLYLRIVNNKRRFNAGHRIIPGRIERNK